MPIQFLCPACSQPIEVDQEWGGRQVACPFCRKAVTAPESSTFEPTAASPMASPAGAASWAGVPTPESATPAGAIAVPQTTTTALAGWALGLASAALVLYFGLNVIMAPHLEELAGSSASPQEMRRALIEQIERSGGPPGWLLAAGLGFALVFAVWVAGLVCGIIAVRRPVGRGRAIASLAICGLMFLLFCVGGVLGGLG